MKVNNKISAAGVRYWLPLIGKFLAGQGAVQAINVVCGLLILRFLPISEYALYTIASLLLVIGSIGSDFGLSQAVNTLGAKIRDDKLMLGALYLGAYRYRKILYPAAVCTIILLATYMMYGNEWTLASATGSVTLIVLTTLIQQPMSLKKSILNIHHDAEGLLHAGLSEAITRLLAVAVCLLWPTAVAALAINLLGVAVGRYFLSKRCAGLMSANQLPNKLQLKQLRQFVFPLAPGVIYYMLQGQIAIFLLSLYGQTTSIAEIGALGRLGQVVGLLMMLNPFVIQPYFARIDQRNIYIYRVISVMSMLFIFCICILIVVFWLPELWLFVLGGNYSRLEKELPLAILGPLLALVGSTLYTFIIAKNKTSGQFWHIILGLGSQVVFIMFFHVHTTFDALILNTLPAASYVVVQAAILFVFIKRWNES